MSKPTWIRIVGWLGLLLAVGWVADLAYIGMNPTAGEAVGAGVVAVFIWPPLCGFWLVATIVHKLMVHNARVKAAAISEISPRGYWVQVPPAQPATGNPSGDKPKPTRRGPQTGPLGL